MPPLTRPILTEFVWLIVAAALTATLTLLCFRLDAANSTIDIHLHDTYFVIAPWSLLIPLFLLITFVIYFVKELRNSFNRTLPNWIFLITGLVLAVALTFLANTFSQFTFGRFTMYPPLSALGAEQEAEMTQDPLARFLTNLFIAMQVVVLVMLLLASYRWGNRKKKA